MDTCDTEQPSQILKNKTVKSALHHYMISQ